MTSLGYVIERNGHYHPNKVALVDGERRMTYAELLERATRLAALIAARGARRQDRVAMLSMNGIHYAEFWAATALAGFIAAPINFRLAAPEVAYILADSAPKILFFEDQYSALVDEVRHTSPELRLIAIGEKPPAWAEPYEEAMGAAEAILPFRAITDDIAHLIYTSGTTGRPKGVARRQSRAVRYADAMVWDLSLNYSTRFLILAPMFHVGSALQLVAIQRKAGTAVIERAFDPLRVLQLIERERITCSFFVAAMIERVLDFAETRTFDLSSIDRLTVAGAPVSLPTVRRTQALLGQRLMMQYGMTEGVATVLEPEEIVVEGDPRQVARLNSVGHATAYAQIRIVDDTGGNLPTNVVGEVAILSDANFDYYWNNSKATAETIRDGWVHSGDMGYMDEQGYVFLVDRKKDMIISGGENIYSREVEEALADHAAVREVAVIGVPDERWGEAVVAIVVTKAQAAIAEAELIEHARTRIARYKCPKAVIFFDELPRVTSGKVDKIALRDHYARSQFPPATPNDRRESAS